MYPFIKQGESVETPWKQTFVSRCFLKDFILDICLNCHSNVSIITLLAFIFRLFLTTSRFYSSENMQNAERTKKLKLMVELQLKAQSRKIIAKS